MSDADDNGKNHIREVNANPLPVDFFMELIDIAFQAMAGKRRMIPPDAERCLEDAPPGSLWLSDCAENQMGMSIVAECAKRFPDERARQVSHSFFFRWWALIRAREAGLLHDFIQPAGEKGIRVNTAIFEAAADMPLDADGDFDERFIEKARALKLARGE